ncbi:MAG: MarR family transcriptional regulator [Parvibaculum sp.]
MQNKPAEQDPTLFPTGHLMVELLEAFMWLDRGLQANLAASGLPHVRRLESMVMLYASMGVLRPTELAKTLGVTRQSVNSAIRELEDKGLVALKADPDDRRCKMIHFTRSGDPIRQQAAAIMTGLEDVLEERIGARAYHQLHLALSADRGEPPLLTRSKPLRKTRSRA